MGGSGGGGVGVGVGIGVGMITGGNGGAIGDIVRDESTDDGYGGATFSEKSSLPSSVRAQDNTDSRGELSLSVIIVGSFSATIVHVRSRLKLCSLP